MNTGNRKVSGCQLEKAANLRREGKEGSEVSEAPGNDYFNVTESAQIKVRANSRRYIIMLASRMEATSKVEVLVCT